MAVEMRGSGAITRHPREPWSDARERSLGPVAFESLELAGRRVLLVASAGGHFEEVLAFADLADLAHDSVVATFETPQTDGLRDVRNIEFVPLVKPRDLRGALRTVPQFSGLVDRHRFDAVVSTGAAVAVPALMMAALRGVRAVYIESYARFRGASATGRVLRHTPGVETYTQHPAWATKHWAYAGSIRAAFPAPVGVPADQADSRALRVLVTLGTIEPYRFDALVDAVLRAVPEGAEITWQLGSTTRDDLPGDVHAVMPHDVFLRAAERADIVISHGGVGTAMTLAQMGKPVILVPRRAARGEHVDDHQVDICAELASDDLVMHREAATLSTGDLLSAAHAG